jgi:branched-subunit amino acid transport protein AzlD
MTTMQMLLTLLISAGVTVLLRALPFLIYRGSRRPPAFITWLGAQLPRAVMAMLVVYCLKDGSFTSSAGWVPALCAAAATAALHVWKRQTILSIAGGTALYMLLLRLV